MEPAFFEKRCKSGSQNNMDNLLLILTITTVILAFLPDIISIEWGNKDGN